jgi:hypothetical protein
MNVVTNAHSPEHEGDEPGTGTRSDGSTATTRNPTD